MADVLSFGLYVVHALVSRLECGADVPAEENGNSRFVHSQALAMRSKRVQKVADLFLFHRQAPSTFTAALMELIDSLPTHDIKVGEHVTSPPAAHGERNGGKEQGACKTYIVCVDDVCVQVPVDAGTGSLEPTAAGGESEGKGGQAAAAEAGETSTPVLKVAQLLVPLLMRAMCGLSHVYCGQWSKETALVDANQVARQHIKAMIEPEDSFDVQPVDASEWGSDAHLPAVISVATLQDLSRLVGTSALTFVMFSAPYCPYCEQMLPAFCAAAKKCADLPVCFLHTKPEDVHALKTEHNIELFPTLKLMDQSGNVLSVYPRDASRDSSSLSAFVQQAVEDMNEEEASARTDSKLGSSAPSLTPSSASLRRRFHRTVREALLRSRLSLPRRMVSVAELYRALGCSLADSDTCVHTAAERPKIIMLGGGMGAGKSTVIQSLFARDDWRDDTLNPVVVEADAMKEHDPLYHKLQDLGYSDAGRRVHQDSVENANILLLRAVSTRRNIVLDGTMMWAPYVEQTIAMLKDTKHKYKQGPGYRTDEEGTLIEEKYWEIDGELAEDEVPAQGYDVHMIGVTVDPSVAVSRGIQRHIITGRGVPTGAQLRSHRLFAENFPGYVPLCDIVELYDNNGEVPLLVAEKKGVDNDISILDESAYDRFLLNRHINENCDSRANIFHPDAGEALDASKRASNSPSSDAMPHHSDADVDIVARILFADCVAC
eukprot:TRINITY_DN1319_c1_g1_i1.p1 TRINITY_DN1319_c1_g1~~TRINITY_DN1319_c1_g1_i1.p1  ORF type:complete len:768 (-),score=164.81 TRINITY_DN1319_c1_g1_i1:54-2201(-)